MNEQTDTADLCDQFPDQVRVALPGLLAFGGVHRAAGEIMVMNIDEENTKVWRQLEEPGNNRLLVINNNANYCAVFGDRMAAIAVSNAWRGVIINGYARDIGIISQMNLGLWALGACPCKCSGKSMPENTGTAEFLGLVFNTGDHVYIDNDGLLLSAEKIDIEF